MPSSVKKEKCKSYIYRTDQLTSLEVLFQNTFLAMVRNWTAIWGNGGGRIKKKTKTGRITILFA